MEQQQKLKEAIAQAEKLFTLRVTKTEEHAREEPDGILNFFLTAEDGQKFFLKEIADHAFRPELDVTFAQLAMVNSDTFRFVLPLAHSKGKYFFSAGDANFHLFRKEDLTYFQPAKMPFGKLRSILQEMHQKIADYQFPKQSFRTFQSWMERPIQKLKEKYGPEVPFISLLEKFMAERFPAIKLAQGNIHWDIHSGNICFDGSGKLVILDLDLLQEGDYACDFTRAACMYSSEEGNQFSLAPDIVKATLEVLRKTSPQINEQDVRFFICRTPMGPMQSPHYFRSQDEAYALLRSFEEFVK